MAGDTDGAALGARDLLLALGFAALSLALGTIQFRVPGVEGGFVDLREVGLLVGVFHLRHWALTLVPAALTSLATPADGSLAGTLITHAVGAPVAWFVHRALVARVDSGLALAVLWAGFVAAWYLLLVLPLMAVTHWIFGLTRADQVGATYLHVARAIPYELATTAATTALYLANRHERGRRRRLEVRLQKAQKMDALGQLAGGMAHDFNNMLAVMTLNQGLVRAQLAAGQDPSESLAELDQAVQHASGVVQQLLSFARRQPSAPIAVDLEALLVRLNPLMTSLIGRSIELHLDVAPGLPSIHADPTMVEQVAMNLVINARDAIGERDERRIVVSARRVAAGVELAVRDTGVGMDPATSARIFEPFFTTKKEGTGLGLATVYGIVRQHGAVIDVASQPGAGTTIRIVWPA